MVFACHRVDVGERATVSMLLADPTVTCWGAEWRALLPGALLLICGFAGGGLVALLSLLRAWRTHAVRRKCVSTILLSYTDKHWWFELFELARRTLLVRVLLRASDERRARTR